MVMAKILITDDAFFMRRMISDIFVEAGHEIIGEAGTAEEGLQKYLSLKPALMTLDMIMPVNEGIDSLEAIKRIRAADANAKILVVSAMGQEQIIAEAIEAGASDFIVKPFDVAKVRDAVTRILAE